MKHPMLGTIVDPSTIPGRNCEGADTETFYPQPLDIKATRDATRLCHGCVALDACVTFILNAEWDVGAATRHGIFGGTTPAQRVQIEARIREKATA